MPDGRITEVDMSSWAMNIDTDRVEVTSFGDRERTYVQGLPSVSGTFIGRWDETRAAQSKPAERPTATLRERRRAMNLEDSDDE